MNDMLILVAAVFLPLFPFSMLFNALHSGLRPPILRALLLLLWPQVGLLIIDHNGLTPPGWLLAWAVLSSLLYALRALALREVGMWIGFLATSSWALIWLMLDQGLGAERLARVALGISVPLVMLSILAAGLERRFGAAYLGLYGGLAQSMPRFAIMLVLVVLAVIATPLFPGFFAMLSMMIATMPSAPLLAVAIGVIWLLWSWAGARLLQGLIVGPKTQAVDDLGGLGLGLYILLLAALIASSGYWLEAIV
ncbi:MAG: hypothetical protein HUJ29_05640 [Gammaproteobacteria bacterium]|nr:hypothetical protein [Gammaproteobacteria bacterium]